MDMTVDVAVIGAGTAGLNARRAALAAGAKRVVMIEGGPYGTTCARVGCMPSKLLIAAAEAAHEMRHAPMFGVTARGGVEIDGEAVMARVQRERDRFVGFVVDATHAIPDEQRLRGWAHFTGPGRLEVELEDGGVASVTAGSVVLAAGTSPAVWAPLVPLGDRVLTSDSIFELPTLPRSIVVLGTGIIGLELGQALGRLGVDTTIFGRSGRIGPLSDPAVQAAAEGAFGDELSMHLCTIGGTAVAEGEGVRVLAECSDGSRFEQSAERLLVATGRRPNTDRLNLEAVGVRLGSGGVPEHDRDTLQCGDTPVFLAGDITGERALLHEASDEGRIAGANAATFPVVAPGVRRTPLSVMFTDPQIAVCGLPFSAIDEEHHAIGQVSYDDQGRARVMGKNKGLVRLYGERSTRRLVGAEMLGPRVENTAHLLSWSMQAGLTVDALLDMPFYHPVIEEGIRTGLRSLAKALDR